MPGSPGNNPSSPITTSTIMITITQDDFDALRPVTNPHADHGFNRTLWETRGAEFNFVRSQPANHVWTLADDPDGPVIISGLHAINRIGYFVTELPWDEECEVR
jgi:hypothetical protein